MPDHLFSCLVFLFWTLSSVGPVRGGYYSGEMTTVRGEA